MPSCPQIRPLLTVLAALAALAGACAGGTTPQDAVREYADAVRADASQEAWRLTTPEYRAAHSRARFDSEFEARVAAGDEYADLLDTAARNDAEVRAELPYSDFETLTLRYTDDGWRITGGVGDLFSQATPRDALHTFLRAMKRRDTQTLLRLVPAEYRAQITGADLDAWMDARAEELTETVALLEASSDAPIRESGDSARLRYGAREIVFAREGGRWVIADFD